MAMSNQHLKIHVRIGMRAVIIKRYTHQGMSAEAAGVMANKQIYLTPFRIA